MSKKAWIIFVVVCVGLLGTLIALSGKDKINVSTVDANAIQAASEQNGNIADHVFGNPNGKVVLLEYGDYQCPGCGQAYSTIKQVTDTYKDQVTFVFRNFPLSSIHPNALVAAAAAEAAGLQGKFWEMHDLLYENQSSWESLPATTRVDFLVSYAKKIGIDTAKFRTDLDSPDVAKKIAYDQALGGKANVTGTPTFTLNGSLVNQYVKDGKIVPASNDANPIWSDADSLSKLLIIPALTKAGVPLPATPAVK